MNFFKKLNYSLLRDPEEEIISYDVSNCSICYLKNEFKPVWAGWNRESKRLLCIDCFDNFNFELLKNCFKQKTRIITQKCGLCKETKDCFIINCCKNCQKVFSNN